MVAAVVGTTASVCRELLGASPFPPGALLLDHVSCPSSPSSVPRALAGGAASQVRAPAAQVCCRRDSHDGEFANQVKRSLGDSSVYCCGTPDQHTSSPSLSLPPESALHPPVKRVRAAAPTRSPGPSTSHPRATVDESWTLVGHTVDDLPAPTIPPSISPHVPVSPRPRPPVTVPPPFPGCSRVSASFSWGGEASGAPTLRARTPPARAPLAALHLCNPARSARRKPQYISIGMTYQSPPTPSRAQHR